MKLKKYDSINVIPFIDVLLVLLAIVLLTSTFITRGIIPISLPNASNADNIKVNKEIIIKEQHNCRSTKYWENQNNSFLMLAHEYIFVFQK